MDRRSFFRYAIAGSGALAICGLSPQAASARLRIPKPVISGFKTFFTVAEEVLGHPLTGTVIDLIKAGHFDPQIEAIKQAVDNLLGTQYSSVSQSPVFRREDHFYLPHIDPKTEDVQVQVVFPPSGQVCQFCFMGGPAIPLLAWSVSDFKVRYPRATRQQLAQYLAPVDVVQRNVNYLTYGEPWQASYSTQAGFVALSYQLPSQRQPNHGIVAMDVYDSRQRAVLSGRYLLPVQ